MTEPTELERVAHLSYLDELVGLQEGWEKLAAKKEKEYPVAHATSVGASLGGVAGLHAAAGSIGKKRMAEKASIQKQEKYVKRLQRGLTHATKQKQPGIAPTVAVQNIPKQRKELSMAQAALKRLKVVTPPSLKGMAWKVPAGVLAGGVAGGVAAHQIKKRTQAK